MRVKTVKPPERQIDPFAKDESHLENIVTKAVMPGYIKKGRLTREEISHAFFDTFVQEKMLRPHKKGASQNPSSRPVVMFDAIAAVQSMGKPSRKGMCQKRLVTYRAVIYKIAVDAVIGKTTMKDLLSCNQNKEANSSSA
ncbi:unnamed protein product [Porites lobata]|uniref:Uncharacterized protein n=1 Tax=Porites lobata TaxID=104759 RepID=A0ABN8R2M4_9CNID|nr:unnamed protein product [Porites lobata]